MTAYKIQYWLYAIVAKHLGQNIRIARDPLHRRYEVNRHGMYLSSKSIPVSVMEKVLREILLASGYVIVKHYGEYFTKSFGKKRPTISLSEERGLDGSHHLHISLMVY